MISLRHPVSPLALPCDRMQAAIEAECPASDARVGAVGRSSLDGVFAGRVLAVLNTQKAGVESSLATKRGELAAAKTRLENLTATAATAQNAVNAQMAAIETATKELGVLVAQGDAAQVLVDAAEKKLADARAALPGLEATAKTADTNAAAATAAVVKAEENLRLTSRASPP